jgi:hypothetical protein
VKGNVLDMDSCLGKELISILSRRVELIFCFFPLGIEGNSCETLVHKESFCAPAAYLILCGER